MSPSVPEETRRQILRYRALDYTKEEIAEELDLSRNTVSRHLTLLREELEEESDMPTQLALAEYLFVPEDVMAYAMDQTGAGDAIPAWAKSLRGLSGSE